MAKKTRAQRKAANIRAETQRRIDAGDRSSYVQKSGKQHGLNVPTRTPYNPNKVSNVIKETTGLSGRDAHLANQAFRAQTANNQRIQEQNARRRRVEEAFARNGSVSKGDFTGNMGDGIFGLNTGRATPTGRPKLREGLTSAEYHDWMRKLNKLNRPMMEQIFPWGSGKTARGLVTLATPLKYLEKMPSLFGNQLSNVKEGLQNIFPGAMENLGFEKNKLMQNFEGIGGRFQNDLQALLSGKNQNLPQIKSTATQEDIVSPAALSRTDQVPSDTIKDQYNIGDYFPMSRDNAPQFTTANLPPSERFPDWLSDPAVGQNLEDVGYWDQYDTQEPHAANITDPFPEDYKRRRLMQLDLPENMFNQIDPYLNPNLPFRTDSGTAYYADGGDIQSDAYARLKAINDSMHEM